jgi:hypothetical protein
MKTQIPAQLVIHLHESPNSLTPEEIQKRMNEAAQLLLLDLPAYTVQEIEDIIADHVAGLSPTELDTSASIAMSRGDVTAALRQSYADVVEAKGMLPESYRDVHAKLANAMANYSKLAPIVSSQPGKILLT